MRRRTTVIIGAGRGIGRATALALAESGQQLMLAARSEVELQDTAESARERQAVVEIMPCDVTDEKQVASLMKRTAEWAGTIDLLVCAAGSVTVGPFEESTLEEWEWPLQVTLRGSFLACKYALPHMKEGGLIVLLSSIAGRSGFPGWSAYSAAKFALEGFAQAIREELRPRGIRVVVVRPGAVDTSLWENIPGTWQRDRMLSATDVARAIRQVADTPHNVSIDELSLSHPSGKL